MDKYRVVVHHGRKGWTAEVADLPGVFATGKTRDEVKERIFSAIEFHVEGLRLAGEPVPEPGGHGGFTVRQAEELLTTTEAADELGVSPARVRQLILQGRLRGVRFGRDLAILQKDLDTVRVRPVGRPARASTVQGASLPPGSFPLAETVVAGPPAALRCEEQPSILRRLSARTQKRLDILMRTSAQGCLTPAERTELLELVRQAEEITHANAALLALQHAELAGD